VIRKGPVAVDRGLERASDRLGLGLLGGEGLPTRPVCPGGACLLEPTSPHARVFL
jgi:hypothetical protein